MVLQLPGAFPKLSTLINRNLFNMQAPVPARRCVEDQHQEDQPGKVDQGIDG
jgi:hypothetical protein